MSTTNRTIRLRELKLIRCLTNKTCHTRIAYDREEFYEWKRANLSFTALRTRNNNEAIPEVMFTVHGNPVRCLLLKLPPRVPLTNESLNAVLSQFCPIEDILIYRRLALVTVTTHRDAVKLYFSQELRNQNIKVYPADSFHQPDNSNYPCKCTRFVSATKAAVKKGRKFTLFMKLPDSCILNIFKFVSIPNLVKLEWSSMRLNDLLNKHYKVRCKKILLIYTKNEKRNILDSLAAHHIETLTLQSLQFTKYDCSTDNILYRLILKNCLQLKVLNIAHSHVPPFFWKAFDYVELEVLKMSYLICSLDALGDVISKLSFPKLHTLELSNIRNLPCTPLLKLRNIHTFSLRDCGIHRNDFITCFLRNNANTIRNLDVFHAATLNVAMMELTNVPNLIITPEDVPSNFDSSKFLMSVRHLTIDLRPIRKVFGIPEILRTFAAVDQLEKLRIFKNWDLEIKDVSATLDTQREINVELLKFRNLKHVAFNITHVNDIIERFVQNNSNLETVALEYPTLTIETILDIISSGPNIQLLDISYNHQIKEEFIKKVIETVVNMRSKRDTLLSIIAHDTGIEKAHLEDEELAIHRYLVKITTEHTKHSLDLEYGYGTKYLFN